MSPKPRLLTRFGDVFYAFDKPAGMAVYPANEDIEDLVSWIRTQKNLPRDLKPAHRLDRATSGVVLCGAGSKARGQLNAWLEEGSLKMYQALVAGEPEEDEGILTSPLFDERRKRPLTAKTRYRVIERFDGFAWLELELITGRKHQLRRHLVKAGWPIVGDERYGPKRPKRVPGFPGRLWLHAVSVQLVDRRIEAKLPEDLEQHLERLRQPKQAESGLQSTDR